MYESIEKEKGNVKEYNYCIRCGRRLKSEENRKRGMGKICYEKYLKQKRNGIYRLDILEATAREFGIELPRRNYDKAE